jgi:hypothetical protein
MEDTNANPTKKIPVVKVSKLSQSDHDLLIHLNELLEQHIGELSTLNNTVYGENKGNGLVGDVRTIKGKLIVFYGIGAAMLSGLGYLVALHIHV